METDYDQRLVRYEAISHYPPWMFDALIDTANPQPGDRILDLGAGYGAVTQGFLRKVPQLNLTYHLVEKSPVQVERAKSEILPVLVPVDQVHVHFHNADFLDAELAEGTFSIIVAKMSIHEFSASQQEQVLDKVFRLLKPGGRFYIWQTVLDHDSVGFYRKLMQKKDSLCGYDTLARDRNFLSETETVTLLRQTGFNRWGLCHNWAYPFETSKRLDSEFEGDRLRLATWNNYLTDLLQANNHLLYKKLDASCSPANVSLQLNQAIYEAQKS